MLELNVTEQHIKHAKKIVSQHSFGNRGHNDGTTEQQHNGMIGETVVREWLGFPLPVNLYGADDGFDFEINSMLCDIKTAAIGGSHEYVPEWVRFMVIENQIHQTVDYYLFTVYMFDRSKLFIAGCVAQFDFKRNCQIARRGDRWPTGGRIDKTNYYVMANALRPVYSFADVRAFAESVNWRKNQWHQKRFPPVELPK